MTRVPETLHGMADIHAQRGAHRIKLDRALAEIEQESDLAHYAAHAAAKVLAQNWKDDGRNHPDDIDDVIAALCWFKLQIR